MKIKCPYCESSLDVKVQDDELKISGIRKGSKVKPDEPDPKPDPKPDEKTELFDFITGNDNE